MLHIDPKYGKADADTELFLFNFDEPKGCSVLEVGANDEYAANILTDNKYDVLGVDILPHKLSIPPNYTRTIGDFCRLEFNRQFDCIFSLSAVEHFGLTTYGDTENQCSFYDAAAMLKMWTLLKPGGSCYITVPFGCCFIVYGIHWRVYNDEKLFSRITQKFRVEKKCFFTSGDAMIDGENRKAYQPVTEKEANGYIGHPPHVTVLLKMKK